MDLNAIKSRLNEMQKTSTRQSGEERKAAFWKPTIGK